MKEPFTGNYCKSIKAIKVFYDTLQTICNIQTTEEIHVILNFTNRFIDNITNNRMCLLTQSLPKRRWIPTKGPSMRCACMKLLAKSTIFPDHLKYCCKCLLYLATGKLPGAPENASTGCLATGNLQRVQR